MLNIIKNPFANKKLFKAVILFTIIVSFFLIKVNGVQAGDVDSMPTIINWGSGTLGGLLALILGVIAYILTAVIGFLVTVVVAVLIQVAQYGNIINVPTVITGWVIIRDLCNMSFILILLIIAFATILRQENFSAKKILPKLLIMAILINFSRSIFGLLIDLSQIVMLTFVNAFAAGGGHVIDALKVDKWLTIKSITGPKGTEAADQWAVVVAIIASVLAAIITLIVLSVMLAVLVARIVMFWIYTIFSPLIFLGFAFTPLQKYTGKLWEDFTKQLVVGPVLAFFIWLALTTASGSTDLLTGGKNLTTTQVCVGAGAFFCEGNFQKFIIVIGLLMGGLMVAQQMGGAAGSIAGKGLDWAKGTIGTMGKGVKTFAGFNLDKASEAVGFDLNVSRGYQRLKAQMADNKKVRENKIYGQTVETAKSGGLIRSKLALASTGDVAWQNVTSWNKGKNLGRFMMGGKWADKKGKENEAEGKVLKNDREQILSKDENNKITAEINSFATIDKQKETEWKKLIADIAIQEGKVNLNPDDEKAQGKLEKLQSDLVNIVSSRKDLKDKNNQNLHDAAIKTVDDVKAKDLDEKILKNKEGRIKWNLSGASAALALNNEEAEALQAKKISSISSAEELGAIHKQAVEEGNQGMQAATAKKMAKNYDYNELCKVMGFGTGLKGLQGLAEVWRTKGGMTEDRALGLLGEIGVITKNIGHFGGYGAVTMEGGKWRKSSENEYESAKLAEMLKMQPQQFARMVNRLGLGTYETNNKGEAHSMDNWKISKAATAYFKLNAAALAKQYKDTGQQGSIEHMLKDINVLEKNDVNITLINTIKERGAVGQGKGADTETVIKSIK